MINERFLMKGVTRVGGANSLREVKKERIRLSTVLMVFDRSILKSPIKIISLDSSQTTSIIDTNLSVQFCRF